MEVEYAGAHNSLIIVRNGNKPLVVNNSEVEADYADNSVSLYEIRAERQPIGSFANTSSFRNNTISVEREDSLYVFSDGIIDQFGGSEGKKFMRKQIKTLLMDLQSLTMEERKDFVEKSFFDWKGNYNQIDDVLLFGVRI
jgi:serine phosphatase RsbU (regulator of sigma subunit)